MMCGCLLVLQEACDGRRSVLAMLESGLQGLHLGVKLTPHLSCTVDPAPTRAIHCLDLSATCPSDPCDLVHFGYAIPVRVHEIAEGWAELVLEPLRTSPNMATTATASSSTPVRCEPDEDIAAIAKQISDHAEAIYQTWKSRGLAPAEILTCHNNETAADKFGSALTPPSLPPQRSPSIELLAQAPTMDNNRLERLVNNFVFEDKARLAAAKHRQPLSPVGNAKSMPSSIQYALQKFEKNVQPVVQQQQQQQQPPPQTVSGGATQPKLGPKPQISPKPRFPMAETIEYTLPPDLSKTSGPGLLQTWPLKNRVVGTDAVKQRAVAEVRSTTAPVPTMTINNKATSNYAIDQVALEEKRLINALKNGVILSDDRTAAAPAPNTTKLIINTKVSATTPDVVTRWGPRTGIARRPEHQPAPHPELTNTQRQHLRHVQQAAAASPNNPIRPFLTRGSVAERVLIFERCPSDLLLDKRPRTPAAPKCQVGLFITCFYYLHDDTVRGQILHLRLCDQNAIF